VAIWNARVTLQSARTTIAKAGSVVTALALVFLVWFTFAFHLISPGIN